MHDEISVVLTDPRFIFLLKSRIGGKVEICDIQQMAWIKARLEACKSSIPQGSNLFAWLLCVAQNCAWDARKAESRRKRREKDYVGYSSFVSNYPERAIKEQEVLEATDDTRPFDKIERRERRVKILQAIRTARLPKNHQCALWAGLRGNDNHCAARFGVSSGTIRVWALRARQKSRAALKNANL